MWVVSHLHCKFQVSGHREFVFTLMYSFFSMLIQSGAPIIPISHILSVPVLSSLGSPTTAAISSILSIGTSIAALVIKCRVNIFGLLHDWNLNDRYTKRTVFGAVLTGAFAPLMCLMYSSSLIEFIFWIIPLVVLGMYYTALSMMNQVQDSLEELEKSKYKYKGA